MNNMKTTLSALLGLMLLLVVGCDDYNSEAESWDQGFAQLDNDAPVSILENSGDEVEIIILLGGPQSTDTQINLDITGDASRYMISDESPIIAAGDTSATVILTAIDDDEINGDVEVLVTLSTNSDVPIGVVGQGLRKVSKSITIVDDNVPCNDYVVTVITDFWANETHWYIINDDTGERVLEGGGDLSNGFGQVITEEITLPDGCYTFRIWDEFGDGMVSADGDGSYSVQCGSIVAAQGSGVFDNVGVPGATGADLPAGWTFQAAPTADLVGFVEQTSFCVNQ
jgi:hypothetical protein